MSKITHIELDDAGLPAPTPEIEQERKVAIFDLLEDNSFALPGRDGRAAPAGPYALTCRSASGGWCSTSPPRPMSPQASSTSRWGRSGRW